LENCENVMADIYARLPDWTVVEICPVMFIDQHTSCYVKVLHVQKKF